MNFPERRAKDLKKYSLFLINKIIKENIRHWHYFCTLMARCLDAKNQKRLMSSLLRWSWTMYGNTNWEDKGDYQEPSQGKPGIQNKKWTILKCFYCLSFKFFLTFDILRNKICWISRFQKQIFANLIQFPKWSGFLRRWWVQLIPK